MRTLKHALALFSMSALALGSAAQAAPGASSRGKSSEYNCWGVVSSQLAHVEGGLGEHSSSFDSPRLGLGNVARIFYDMGLIGEPSVSALGSFLATLDEYDETTCMAG